MSLWPRIVSGSYTKEFVALTAIIPWPRIGGSKEQKIAKKCSGSKLSRLAVEAAASTLDELDARIIAIEENIVKQNAAGLHELRKFNRIVKQNAERMCRAERPDNPEKADSRLVNIWKASEMMSQQFDAVELLANERLVELPLTNEINICQIFDKCVRIFNSADGSWRISIKDPSGYDASIMACDKTFPIIPSSLIENAVKYSIPLSEIHVQFSSDGKQHVVTVSNLINTDLMDDGVKFNNDLFQKGVRFAKGKEGSGNGLYLAEMVAHQHSGVIEVSEELTPIGFREVTFTAKFPTKSSRKSS